MMISPIALCLAIVLSLIILSWLWPLKSAAAGLVFVFAYASAEILVRLGTKLLKIVEHKGKGHED